MFPEGSHPHMEIGRLLFLPVICVFWTLPLSVTSIMYYRLIYNTQSRIVPWSQLFLSMWCGYSSSFFLSLPEPVLRELHPVVWPLTQLSKLLVHIRSPYSRQLCL